MIYRELGKTGLKVSQLGFGAMRLPMVGQGEACKIDRDLAIPMLHKAFEGGVNYVDTAVGYCNYDSQRVVGEAVEAWKARGGGKIIVSTKNPYYGEDEKTWWQNLEDSLSRLRIDCIDIYNHHGMNWEPYTAHVEPRVGKWMHKARQQGLIRNIANSFHDDNQALRNIVDTGYTSCITLQYNMLDRGLEDGIAYAHSKGVGIVVMGPVAGGRLGASSDVLAGLVPGIAKVPELALRFVLSNPNVSMALSGMSTMQQVQENLAIASDTVTLSQQENDTIRRHAERLAEMAKLYCTNCRYCMPCPHEVNIPAIFEKYNWGRVYGLWEPAAKAYEIIGKEGHWEKGAKADACKACGACEKKCPQKIPIVQQLKDAHGALKNEKP